MKQRAHMTPRSDDSKLGVRGLVCFASALVMLATATAVQAGALDRATQSGILQA